MADYRKAWLENNDSNCGWYECVRCGKKLRKGDMDIDHIVPQSYGGGHELNNLQCMCRSCNRSKQDDIGMHTVNDYARNTSENTSRSIKKGLGSFLNFK